MDELNISEMLNKEIEKVNLTFNIAEENEKYNQLSNLITQISSEVMSKIEQEVLFKPENRHYCRSIFSGLWELIDSKDLSLDSFWANQIFYKIDDALETKRIEFIYDEIQLNNIDQIKDTLEMFATYYFREQIESQIKSFDLPKSLFYIKRRLTDKVRMTGKFEESALYQLKDEIETDISYLKEERFLREELKDLPNDKNVDNSKNEKTSLTSKHKDLTLDRAVLFISYLFTELKVNCHNTKKAKVISFLTGYSEKTIGNKLSSLHSKSEINFNGYEKDMKVIRKYYEDLGLTKIIEMINRDFEF